MEGLFILIVIFSYSFGTALSTFVGVDSSSVLKVLAVSSLFFCLIECYKVRRYTFISSQRKSLYRWLLLYIAILIGMGIVILIHDRLSGMMESYILSYGTKVLSGILLGYVIVRGKLAERKIIIWIAPFFYVFSLILLYFVSQNNGLDARLLMMDRQTLAYSAAYSAAMLLFLNSNDSIIPRRSVFSLDVWKFLNFVFITCDFIAICSARGRGAFVLFFVVFAYYAVKDFSRFTVKSFFRGVGIVLFTFIIIITALQITTSSENFKSLVDGFISGLQDRSSEDRRTLYRLAYKVAESNWFMGAGPGSTAYNVGFYTHSLFFDVLVDYGFGGVLIGFIIILKTLRKGFYYSKQNVEVEFLFVVFICGLVGLLFSGSIYSDTMIWVGLCGISTFKLILPIGEHECTVKNEVLG